MLRKILLLSVVVAALSAATPALAHIQILCDMRLTILNTLTSEYGEEVIETERIKGHGLLEVLKSQTTGTWTLLFTLTKPGNISCVLAMGRDPVIDERSS